jgi:hypothetical protein
MALLRVAGVQRATLEKRKQAHEIHMKRLKDLSQRREHCTKIPRFLNNDKKLICRGGFE